MEPEEQDKAALISDIESDARAEAEAILKEAEALIADKREYAGKQVETILQEARLKAQEQAEATKSKAIRVAEREVRRRSMHLRATVVQQVMDQVEKRLATMVQDAGYRSALVNWIAEAAIGLGTESAAVNASEQERAVIDDRMLAEAARQVRAATGVPVALTLSTAAPLSAQGVVLTASDGRTAFNNQVKTRLRRSSRRIDILIHDCLFTDENREE